MRANPSHLAPPVAPVLRLPRTSPYSPKHEILNGLIFVPFLSLRAFASSPKLPKKHEKPQQKPSLSANPQLPTPCPSLASQHSSPSRRCPACQPGPPSFGLQAAGATGAAGLRSSQIRTPSSPAFIRIRISARGQCRHQLTSLALSPSKNPTLHHHKTPDLLTDIPSSSRRCPAHRPGRSPKRATAPRKPVTPPLTDPHLSHAVPSPLPRDIPQIAAQFAFPCYDPPPAAILVTPKPHSP